VLTRFKGIRAHRSLSQHKLDEVSYESFYDFHLDHLLWLLGEDWYNAEMAKPSEERRII